MGLTRYKEGSIGELWTISLPLMVSSFSMMLMLFVDRFLLAQYSNQALNAAVNASTLGWSFLCGWLVLASIAEVFVAQYNGSKQPWKMGEPIWQMIWLSLGSLIFFIPMTLWGAEWFFGRSPDRQMQRDYFHYMMIFGPSYPIYGALVGFFVGQGKTKLVSVLALVANIVNAGLDYIFIFGIEGWFPSYGVKGAAIATNLSTVFQVLVLSVIFLNKKHRESFNTLDWKFKLDPFLQCLRIGLPGAVFVTVEILAWAVYYWMMTLVGEEYITIAGISQSVFILFYFWVEGVHKAATAIAGNLIGAERSYRVPKILKSGLKLNLVFLFGLLALLYFSSETIIEMFLPDVSPQFFDELHDPLLISLFFIIIYLFFEGMRMLLSGLLTAAGDTFFLFIAGSTTVWVFLVFPVYITMVRYQLPVEVAASLCVFYSIVACTIYYLRFLSGKWKSLSVIKKPID